MPIGVERGWCTRADARDLTLTTLRFFWNAPQGPGADGARRDTRASSTTSSTWRPGCASRTVELSSVDTTLLLLGMLFAGQYFDRDDAGREPRSAGWPNAIYARADWNFFRSDGRAPISMGWHPETGLIPANWVGYNEGMMVNILALGAPVHAGAGGPVGAMDRALSAFLARRGAHAPPRLRAACSATSTASIFIDFRGIRDAPMRAAGFDYFENSRRATYANRAYCIANPMRWDGYSERIWGLTACDGPGGYKLPFKGEQPDLLRLCGARTFGRTRRARRRDAGADGSAWFAALRARDRDPRRGGFAC